MRGLIEIIYDWWTIIEALSVIIGVISFFKSFIRRKDNTIVSSVFGYVLVLFFATIAILTFIVHISFTKMPLIQGLSVNEAYQLLNEKDLTPLLEDNNPLTIESVNQTVINQPYKFDELLLRGQHIVIQTSNSEKTIISESATKSDYNQEKVPNVVGMELNEAIKYLLNWGFEKISYDGFEKNNINYYVFSQSIPADTYISDKSDIMLTILGKKVGEKTVVPNVVGLEQMEATLNLIDNGLFFQVLLKDDGKFEFSDEYYIAEQSIAEGSVVDVGTLVKLKLMPKLD